MLFVVRPLALRHLRTPTAIRTGTDALVGQAGVVLEPVDGNNGRIKLKGEVWSARSYDPSTSLDAGRHVEIVQIEGATAIVYESESDGLASSRSRSSPSWCCWCSSRWRRPCGSCRRPGPGVVERLGRYSRTLTPGLTILVPFIDRLRPLIDLREQVVSFPPQPVITADNLVVSIDTVIYFQVTDAKAATYEIANYIQGVEQLTVTTLRNVVGNLNLEETLTSRDHINAALRGVLDEATGKWGIRVNRVEIKAIDPPPSIQDSMEKQMRADREKRATILTAEGFKQSQILTAEGERQAAILKAEGDAQAAVLRADGEAQAIQKVFDAIHAGDPDQKLLAYQYLQMLPKIAQGDSNKLWIVPSELGEALKGIGGMLGTHRGEPTGSAGLSRSPCQPASRSAYCPASLSTRATYQSAWL